MKKPIIIGVIVAAVVAVGLTLYFFKNLNSLVAAAIEKYGGDATGTRVSVAGVEISLRAGRGSIKGLRVANPQGFSGRDAFSLADITVDIDLGSVRDNPVIIDEIRIQAPVVYAEVKETGASNIDALRKQVDSHRTGSDESGGSTTNIRIKTFVFEKGRINVDATALGVQKQELALPEIRLTDVGGKGGAPPDEVTKVILTAFAKNVASEIARSEVNGLIREQLGESLSDKAKGLLDKVTK